MIITRIREFGIVFAVIAITAVALGPASAHAASSLDGAVSIAPVSQEMTLSPGQTGSGVMYVDTLGDTPISPHIYITPYGVSGESYSQDFSHAQLGHDPSSWIHTDATSYTNITRGHRATLHYTVQVPQGAAPGGYYAVIFAQEDAPPPASGTAALGQNTRTGTILYLTVNGDLIHKGAVASWKSAFWQTSPPLHSELVMSNTGNVHFDASYTEVITDFFGNKKAILTGERTLLPASKLLMDVDWAQSPQFGLYKVGGTVTFLGHTQILPVRYVLMLSAWAFIAMVAALVALTLFAIFSRPKNVTRTRRRRK